MTAAADEPAVIAWGWAGTALELESGDLHVVVPFRGGALIALIDGLGHGPDAADAARTAGSVLGACASEPVTILIERCHDALRRTRGAVMTLASLRSADSLLTWIGVGNVEGILVRGGHRSEAVSLRGGVIGYQLPALRATAVTVAPGDVVIMATDGIRGGVMSEIANEVADHHAPQEIAESILARFAQGSDDAHVVVARYLGGRS
jgi:negative regulator of sigma-B (phosphoserine phosphatase)